MSLLYQNKNFFISIPNNLETNYEINYISNVFNEAENINEEMNKKEFNEKMTKIIKDSFNSANDKLLYDDY